MCDFSNQGWTDECGENDIQWLECTMIKVSAPQSTYEIAIKRGFYTKNDAIPIGVADASSHLDWRAKLQVALFVILCKERVCV